MDGFRISEIKADFFTWALIATGIQMTPSYPILRILLGSAVMLQGEFCGRIAGTGLLVRPSAPPRPLLRLLHGFPPDASVPLFLPSFPSEYYFGAELVQTRRPPPVE